jgi:hypothetical protein
MDRSILRSVTGAGMYFPGRPHPKGGLQANDGAKTTRISSGAMQSHAQARSVGLVLVHPGFGCVLADHKIDLSIAIKISHGSAALLAVNPHAGLPRHQGLQSSGSVPFQPQPASSVQAGPEGPGGKEVLTQKHIFMAIVVNVCNMNRKCRSPLRFVREWNHFKVRPTIQQDNGMQYGSANLPRCLRELGEKITHGCMTEIPMISK